MSNINKKLNITWPESHFSIQDIQKEHSDARNITLRFRINRAVEDGVLSYIGKTPKPVGRPTIVFAKNPITKKVLQEAVKDGVVLEESFETQVIDVAKVGDIKKSQTTSNTTVNV
jgi:hypothetical protein